jgi:hypothetical protein
MRKPRKKNVPAFWKLITQANFHGRGPPPKSSTSQFVKRRIVTAQAGALAGVLVGWVVLMAVPG